VPNSAIHLSDQIKLLGVTLDGALTFSSRMSNVCHNSYYHIRSLRRIRSFLDLETSKSIASSIIGSRLDYANSLLWGIPAYNIQRLQRVQNSLVRVVAAHNLQSITPSTHLLASLHWLPIQQRITFKLCALTYSSLHNTAPQYLSSFIQPYIPSRQLRSSNQYLLSQPRVKTTFASRGFRSAGPRLWNSLPYDLKCLDTFSSFKSHLKTHLFSTAFSSLRP
jgi:hypothetical protein